jgi:serine/threonine protein kinase
MRKGILLCMENSKKDLFEHFCYFHELAVAQQITYINTLKVHEPETANKLEALINNNNDITQVFTDSIINFTDEKNSVSIGDKLANFQLTQTLGHGGMGQVFKAERCDGKIDQTVAIKFLHPLFQQYQSGKLLLQEAQALANLSHPNIASIYDISETDNGDTFIVMEYIEGVTLDIYLQENTLSVIQKTMLFNQIADAVLEAHNHQIIHADIKPSNVLITATGQAKLIDFGVMQLAGELSQTAPKLVTHYLCAMTINHASPEQLHGEKASIYSDIYGLGGLLYFMLSGSSPFEEVGGTLAQKIEHITSQRPDDCTFTKTAPFISDLIAILHKALSKHPKDRYRTVTDLINDINAFQEYKKLSVNANIGFHHALKFFYRHRIITAAISSVFIILLVAFVQIKSKNELLTQEKKLLENVNQELKNTFTQQDKNISEAHIKSEAIYLPDPNNLASKQYIEMMFLMFDDYYFKENQPAYALVIDTLMSWLSVQDNIEPLSLYLAKYRKVLSGNKDSDNFQEDAEILSDILAIETPLNSSVLDLLRFKRFTTKLETYFIPLFIRLDTELVKSTLSVKELFAFHSAGGGIYADSDSKQATYHYQKAYELAKNNPDKIKLWVFIATSLDFRTALINSKGYDDEQVVNLSNELYKLIKQTNDKKLDTSKLSLLLGMDLDRSMENVANTLQKYGITFESLKKDNAQVNASILTIVGHYYASLGEYEKAITLYKKSMQLYVSERGSEQGPYLLFRIASVHLSAGNIVTGMNSIEEQILPLSTKGYEKDVVGYFQTKTCKKLALIENTKRLENLCIGGFSNAEESFEKGSYWIKFAASGVVSWYTLQPFSEAENYYVKLLESDFEKSNSVNKINYGTVLLQYYINRKNIEKSIYYKNIVSIAVEADYGSVDAIVRYYNQMMAAEIDLLQNDKLSAITKLINIQQKMCSLSDKNPQKIKYRRLQHSLNQPSCVN